MARRFFSVLLTLVLLVSCLAVLVPVPSADAAGSKLTITGSKVVAVGKKITLKANQKVKWSTSNKKIATVSSKGVVKGIKAGTVKITAKAGSTKKTWKITVKAKPVKSVKITAKITELDLADPAKATVSLKAKAEPKAAAQKFTWKSSNPDVAKVSSSGKVTAVAVGQAKITATAADGSKKKKSVTITVVDSGAAEPGKVGISMPTDMLMRWNNDGSNLKKQLESFGCEVVLKYADNDPGTQAKQIQQMIDAECEMLIVAPVDPSSLGSVLSKAAQKGIHVIAFDRLIMDTKAVSYYVTFDNTAVGKLQGKYIADALNLSGADGPFNIELTAGDPGDSNGAKFFNGAMSVLKPYIDSGKLVVKSGQTTLTETATQGWNPDNAKKRAESILSKYYSDGSNLDAWMCVNDSTAYGVIQALDSQYTGNVWPVVTGQDCDLMNVRLIIKGKQSMSVFKNTITLVERTVSMAKQIFSGKTVETNGKTSNGSISVPTYSCTPSVVTKSNYKKMLIDTGYYSEDDL